MPDLIALSVFKTQKANALKPAIINHNRLEGSPRSEEFEQSLRAEIRDPLWTLCRQWQFGEFQGEDAGTAFQARIMGEQSNPHKIRLPNEQSLSYDIAKPLETVVEREQLLPSLHLRTQMGRYFLKLLKKQALQSYKSLFLQRHPLTVSPPNEDKEGGYLAVAVTGRLPDGVKLLADMENGSYATWIQGEVSITSTPDKTKLKDLQTPFLRWFANLYEQPLAGESLWLPNHLEYNFSLEVPGQAGQHANLIADQYASGRLEWYSFDQASREGDLADSESSKVQEKVDVFMPSALEFKGMPHPRFWQMEEGVTDFGKIDASPTSLLNLLLAEYGLTYSNDWFILPYPLTINTVCEIKGIVVTDVFGVERFVGPALQDPETNWQEFAFFHQTERVNDTEARNRFYLVPALGKLLESDPLEKINFMRDEMSNMVWAIENTVPSEAGGGRDVKRKTSRLPEDFRPADEESLIRYVLGSTVPDNWIPFLPVHKKVPEGELSREIRLQRARLPQAAPPQSKLLTEEQPIFLIEEEEVLKVGTIIERRFQRTRWLNGKTYLWVGRRKMAGRGEGWSGLMFDQILEIER